MITRSQGISRPNGAKSSLKTFPGFAGGSGVSATTLSDGSGGGVSCGFADSTASNLRGGVGVAKGTMSRRTVSGSWGAPALGAILSAANRPFESNGRRLFTMTRMRTRPRRKSVSAPVGERKKLRKTRGFIEVSESAQSERIQVSRTRPVWFRTDRFWPGWPQKWVSRPLDRAARVRT